MSRRAQGFTLVELLVALAVFALIAAAGVGVLRAGLDSAAASRAQLDDTAALRRADALLSADLLQAAPRVTRGVDGVPRPAFDGREGAVALVRGGWANPDDKPRSDLQYVEWGLEGDALVRRAAPMPDGAPVGPPSPMLTGVDMLRLRYLSPQGWRARWDPVRPDRLPPVVEVTLMTRRWGEVRALYLAGPGAIP